MNLICLGFFRLPMPEVLHVSYDPGILTNNEFLNIFYPPQFVVEMTLLWSFIKIYEVSKDERIYHDQIDRPPHALVT